MTLLLSLRVTKKPFLFDKLTRVLEMRTGLQRSYYSDRILYTTCLQRFSFLIILGYSYHHFECQNFQRTAGDSFYSLLSIAFPFVSFLFTQPRPTSKQQAYVLSDRSDILLKIKICLVIRIWRALELRCRNHNFDLQHKMGSSSEYPSTELCWRILLHIAYMAFSN